MKRCPNDRRLVRLFAGDGRAAESQHVASCLACRARYRSLERDMEGVAAALRMGPPARESALVAKRSAAAIAARGRGAFAARGAWSPTLAVAATLAAVVLGWSALGGAPRSGLPRDGRPPGVGAAAEVAAEDGLGELDSAAREVSAALFATGDGRRPGIAETPDYLHASAALSGGWPCGDGSALDDDCTM